VVTFVPYVVKESSLLVQLVVPQPQRSSSDSSPVAQNLILSSKTLVSCATQSYASTELLYHRVTLPQSYSSTE